MRYVATLSAYHDALLALGALAFSVQRLNVKHGRHQISEVMMIMATRESVPSSERWRARELTPVCQRLCGWAADASVFVRYGSRGRSSECQTSLRSLHSRSRPPEIPSSSIIPRKSCRASAGTPPHVFLFDWCPAVTAGSNYTKSWRMWTLTTSLFRSVPGQGCSVKGSGWRTARHLMGSAWTRS